MCRNSVAKSPLQSTRRKVGRPDPSICPMPFRPCRWSGYRHVSTVSTVGPPARSPLRRCKRVLSTLQPSTPSWRHSHPQAPQAFRSCYHSIQRKHVNSAKKQFERHVLNGLDWWHLGNESNFWSISLVPYGCLQFCLPWWLILDDNNKIYIYNI